MEANTDLVIIGGGAAGLTAGMYAAWHGVHCVLVDRMAGAGGCVVNVGNVLNFPGMPGGIAGPDFGAKLAEQAVAMGLAIEYGEVEGISRLESGYELVVNAQPVTCRSVILAVGSTPVRLGCPGELDFEGRGVSYCAVCDGPFFIDQPVVVVGGGDSALDEALHLAETASSVKLLVRGSAFRAAEYLVRLVRAQKKIEISWNTTVLSIEGRSSVEGVRIQDGHQSERTLDCHGIFIYVGLAPSTSLFGKLVQTDTNGHVPVDEWMRTTTPGVFAAGDIRQHSARQLVTVAADGATAAIAAARYLRSGEWR